MSLPDFQSTVDRLARAPADVVTVADRDAAIAAAVARYSQDRARVLVRDVVATGEVLMPLPADWVTGESALRGVVVVTGPGVSDELAAGAFAQRATPAGDELVLASAQAAGVTLRLTFTAPHTLTGTADTVPARDREAVCCLAAASLCEQVAAARSDNREPTIHVDSADQSNPAREWAARARAYRTRYYELLGLPVPGSKGAADAGNLKPAGTFANLDVEDSRLKGRFSLRRLR